MLSLLAGRTLRSLVRNATDREKKFLPWDRIERIALIVQQDQNLNKSALDRFVEESRKYIEVFYVELNSKVPTFGDWRCFSKKDRSPLLGLPSATVASELKHKHFDLVINTCPESNLFSTSLSVLIPATFTCASNLRFGYADLVIAPREPYQLITYLNDIVHYLKMIRVQP